METPAVTKERILLLQKAAVPFFALLAGLLIGTWWAPSADATSPLEVVKAKVTVKRTDGQTIFEVKPAAAEGEEAYVQVVGDVEYPEGALTRLFRPVIKLEPTIVEPDLSLRPVPESPRATTETKPEAKVRARPRRAKTGAIRRTNSRGLPPLPPASFDFK